MENKTERKRCRADLICHKKNTKRYMQCILLNVRSFTWRLQLLTKLTTNVFQRKFFLLGERQQLFFFFFFFFFSKFIIFIFLNKFSFWHRISAKVSTTILFLFCLSSLFAFKMWVYVNDQQVRFRNCLILTMTDFQLTISFSVVLILFGDHVSQHFSKTILLPQELHTGEGKICQNEEQICQNVGSVFCCCFFNDIFQ